MAEDLRLRPEWNKFTAKWPGSNKWHQRPRLNKWHQRPGLNKWHQRPGWNKWHQRPGLNKWHQRPEWNKWSLEKPLCPQWNKRPEKPKGKKCEIKQGVKDIRYDMSTFPCDMDIVSMDMMDMDHLVDLLF